MRKRVRKIGEKRFGEQGNLPNVKLEKRVGSSYTGDGKFQGIFRATPLYFFVSNSIGA